MIFYAHRLFFAIKIFFFRGGGGGGGGGGYRGRTFASAALKLRSAGVVLWLKL